MDKETLRPSWHVTEEPFYFKIVDPENEVVYVTLCDSLGTKEYGRVTFLVKELPKNESGMEWFLLEGKSKDVRLKVHLSTHVPSQEL